MKKKKKAACVPKSRILIVDDQPILRMGLAHLIRGEPDLEVCGEVGDASEVLDAIEALKPDGAVVALPLNAGIGLQLIKCVHRQHPRLRILVFSMHDMSFFAERSLTAGARGYVMKSETPERILEAIRRILNGDLGLSEDLAGWMLDKIVAGRLGESFSGMDRLSDREFEVFHLMGHGLGTRQIAQRLYLSVKTIETHGANIKKKLGLGKTSEIRQQAIEYVRMLPQLVGARMASRMKPTAS
ncbi:MAG: response regulator transcription factor [Planctomycetota bacterium]